MPDKPNYWTRSRTTRRAILRQAATAGGGLAALGLVACGGSKGNTKQQPSGGAAPATIESTQGKPGGRFVFQSGFYGGTSLTAPSSNIYTLAGLVHSGLYGFGFGRPPSNGLDVNSEPDLAQALPEQVDPLTYRVKLKAAQFHNGRAVTSEDVKYSYERYASLPTSTRKSNWLWMDKIETPDPQTVVIKSKEPFADALLAMTANQDGYIMAKEFEESPEAKTKLMGSGPYTWATDTPPVSTVLRKNPNYYNKPYPYFDEITVIGNTDPAKQIADFTSRQVNLTYWQSEEPRDELKRNRPDAKVWTYPNPALQVFFRTDQAPFSDKRVRQALSMAIDRKKIRDAESKGEGEPDKMLLTHTAGPKWGFRKPSEMGAAAKYWQYDPQAAKQLLSAAGVTLPLEFPMPHWDASVTGPIVPDTATLIQAQWRELGIANVKDMPLTLAQATLSIQAGNYDGSYLGQNAIQPQFGLILKQQLWSPPGGVTPPTLNTGHINNPQLSALVDKQLTQLNFEERKQTLRQMEDILAEEQYRVLLSTYSLNYFSDPNLRNIVVPYFRYSGSAHYMKYWWFA